MRRTFGSDDLLELSRRGCHVDRAGHQGDRARVSGEAEADKEIQDLAAKLTELKAELGEEYWMDAGVRDLQATLRKRLGSYGAWAADKAPMHQRTRQAARYEARLAHLLWPR
jgi:hypothetical protein